MTKPGTPSPSYGCWFRGVELAGRGRAPSACFAWTSSPAPSARATSVLRWKTPARPWRGSPPWRGPDPERREQAQLLDALSAPRPAKRSAIGVAGQAFSIMSSSSGNRLRPPRLGLLNPVAGLESSAARSRPKAAGGSKRRPICLTPGKSGGCCWPMPGLVGELALRARRSITSRPVAAGGGGAVAPSPAMVEHC